MEENKWTKGTHQGFDDPRECSDNKSCKLCSNEAEDFDEYCVDHQRCGVCSEREKCDNGLEKNKCDQEEEDTIHKRIHDLHTYHSYENETTFSGKDEHGKEFTLTFDTYELLNWLDIKYMKESLNKYIKKL